MLTELLEELKKAIAAGDTKTAARITKDLNKLGMDNYTIKILLSEV